MDGRQDTVKYLITKKCDGSIVDFGHLDHPPSLIEDLLLNDYTTMAVTLDKNNGNRIRYERD